MIVSVADTGTLELFWRHAVSRYPNRTKTAGFVSQVRGPGALNLVRQLFDSRGGGDQIRLRLFHAICSGECLVLRHRGETRWHGTRMPVTALSSSALVLSRARTHASRDLDKALHWLRDEAAKDAIQPLWKTLWISYGRTSAADPPSSNEFVAEAEHLLTSGELIPVFHPLPAVAATVVTSPGAGVEGAAARSLPPPPEPATFDPDHHIAAQVQSLQNAAQAGVPFCEVCEKAAAAARQTTTWIEIVLLDSDDNPVEGQRYEIQLPDGSVQSGVTGADGMARHDGIPAGQCQVRFPDLDGTEWEPVK